MERTAITVYTDGSCLGNTQNSPGGWAAIIVHPKKELVLRGFCTATTNNRMELTAVIEAVKALTKPCSITIVTDSTYVIMDNSRMAKWLNKSDKYKNMDLWQELVRVAKDGHHKIAYQHVYGHTGQVYNERCDRIAKEQALKARKEKSDGVLP